MRSLGVARSSQADDGSRTPREKALRFQWPSSVLPNLAIAAVVGLLYGLWVMGPRPINPRNIDWLTQDGAQHEIAWELFRQDPHLHWPITFTDRIGYPQGESMSLLDPDPLLAVLLKPFSRLLTQPFQYQGIEAVLACTLQFFFALLLFRLLLGSNPFFVLVPALFFLIAPPLTWRFAEAHYALSNHWLILATLLVIFQSQMNSTQAIRGFATRAIILSGVAIAINPYLALQVLLLLTAGVATLLWQRRLTLTRAAALMAAMAAAFCVVAFAFGLFISGGHGYAASGYRLFSLNLLALIDSQGHGSLLPALPRLFEQYEGYNYLGLGVIVLAAVALAVLVLQGRKKRLFDRRILVALFVCCLILTALALSTKVVGGSSTLIDLDRHEKLTPYLAMFRASGRLFWTPYYVLLGTVLVATVVYLPRTWAAVLLSAALALQIVDTSGLRSWCRSNNNQPHPSPLLSPVWSKLGAVYKNLIILPPWQCGHDSSPGGFDGYRIFGFLAAAQHMRINSYYAARYTEVNRAIQCGEAITELSHKPLSADSAYVVTPDIAEEIAEGPTGPGKCHTVDRLILCSSKTDFGLSPVLANPREDLRDAILDASFEKGDLSRWPSWLSVKAAATTSRAHNGTHSLAESAGEGSVYQDATGLEPNHTYTVAAWLSGSYDATATGQIAVWDPGTNLATYSEAVSPRYGWQLVTKSVTVSGSGTLRIHLFRNQGTGTIFWDDVHIYREP